VLNIRLSDRLISASPQVLAVAVGSGPRATLQVDGGRIHADLRTALDTFLVDSNHSGSPGSISTLPPPGSTPRRVLLVGVGDGSEGGWR